jgi:drug/metabolite transporter (DMT)-like permease
MTTGGASMLLIARLTGEAVPTTVSAGPLLSLVYLTLVGSVIAFSAYNHLLEHARPALAMSYAYVNPVIAVFLGALLGAERIGAEVLVATAMIVGAVFLLIRGRGGARSGDER